MCIMKAIVTLYHASHYFKNSDLIKVISFMHWNTTAKQIKSNQTQVIMKKL